ncbi:4-(cytidine 5'-diphospho)-2-C-methyl-D-erythritol kinase [Candidatus Williamhamiltonella defendens]|uniref:4-(cytidine 5'-diphospho)-2-C-methyl-D-erythritol kinase n=1 Tax=Candidatus Williamhamiltonella defendens TaxID=138072 RepID=UPI00130E4968|nr:4-(cytidine 5'-diphospho)-2-C-methyl-D-erythritol kinase [Candidatus Hamiltonella defensa]
MKLVLDSPAKLNVFLYITGKQPDGYHQLQTLFIFLNYGDEITIVPRQDEQILLMTPIPNVSHDQNLVVQAARLLQQQPRKKSQTGSLPRGAEISIKKYVPIGGGLGGGSSNAATVLLALNHLWGFNFSENELAVLGLKLGTDVPVFIYGNSAFAEGVGDRLQPVKWPPKWYLVLYSDVKISTKMIFSDPKLKRNTPRRSLSTLLAAPYHNDCEPIVRKHFPKVDELLSLISKYAPARLTGTGACIFSEFNTESEAHDILEKVPKGIYGFVTYSTQISPVKKYFLDIRSQIS